ncbi:hypothetical protein R3P38DRAFT_3488617 [Favolaschia claudopus]|uniref:Gag protein n=1 Tax=Favolaschia claudopus TaxID=2862362 RepID=A0AAW0E655_9AGAR
MAADTGGDIYGDDEDDVKIYKFQRALYPGSAAEKWWKDLKDGDKSDFATLVKAFDAKWPMPQFISRPQALVINEIKANKLPLNEVGQVVKDEDGMEVLSHQAWAQRTWKLLADIPSGDSGTLLMEHVRDGLPVALRRLITPEAKLDSWEKWLAAVEAIDLHALNDVREEHGLPRGGVLDTETWGSPSNAENEAAITNIAQRLRVTYMLSPQRTPPPPPRRVTTPYTPQAARLSQPEFTSRPSQPRYNPPTYSSTPPQCAHSGEAQQYVRAIYSQSTSSLLQAAQAQAEETLPVSAGTQHAMPNWCAP